MLPIRDLIDSVHDEEPPSELGAAREALDRRTRRHVERAARRGEALLDGPSARYAVAIARQELETAATVREWRWLLIGVVVIGPFFIYGAQYRGDLMLCVVGAVAMLVAGWGLSTSDRRRRRAEATLASNLPLASGTTDAPHLPATLSASSRLAGLVALGVMAAAIAFVAQLAEPGHHADLRDSLEYGVIASLVAWGFGRSSRRPPSVIEIPKASER